MRRLAFALALALALPAAAGGVPAPTTTPKAAAVEVSGLVPTIKPQVEIVFAIDTTGSMGGLIDGAKKKIWAIANEVARAQQQPEVKIGLVAFRDRGDAYVTQTTALTDNLDAVYETLMALRADGGGDSPEDVNAALTDAVHKMAWSEKKGTLKMIFLVGDAPPHMDYGQQQKWQQTAQEAIRKNIYINTVQCGLDGETTAVWKQIAHAAEGRYAAIPQDGGVRVAAVTPFDGELVKLATELDATNFTYGRESDRKAKVATRAKAGEYAAAAPASAAAERAVAKSSLGSGMRADEDLITLAETSGGASVALDKVAKDNLPEALIGKSKEEQTKIVETNLVKRKAIQSKIAELSKKRDQHLAAAAAAAPTPARDSFDAEVNTAMHAEGEKAGLSW